jgi:hypothetical protein
MNSAKLLRSGYFLALLLILLSYSGRVPAQESSALSASTSYYPLASGNQWTYRVMDAGNIKAQRVIWRVVNKGANSEGEFFALWPHPMESDDSGMQLRVSASGIEELASEFYVLRFPLTQGTQWTTTSGRVFQILEEGKPCTCGKLKFSRCLVVRDDDPEAALRTITTYATAVGPVRYQYFRMKNGHPEDKPLRTMELVKYHVAQWDQSKK